MFKAKPNCKVAIKRADEERAWKYNLWVESADNKRLKIWSGSKLPADIKEGVWQIDLVTDTTQIDRVIYAVEWYSKEPLPFKKVMHDHSLTKSERAEANRLPPVLSGQVAVSHLFSIEG